MIGVDPDTGHVDILNYSMAHDSGTLINPFVVDGQVQGAVARGWQRLLEWMIYDGNANPVSATFAEYLLPSAPETPSVDVTHVESPTPINPLGVKGAARAARSQLRPRSSPQSRMRCRLGTFRSPVRRSLRR